MESTRQKSCNQCKSAKSRCSLTFPTCLRCARRNLSCDYPNRQRSVVSTSPSQKQNSNWPENANRTNGFGYCPQALDENDENRIRSLSNDRTLPTIDYQLMNSDLDEILNRPDLVDWTNNQSPSPLLNASSSKERPIDGCDHESNIGFADADASSALFDFDDPYGASLHNANSMVAQSDLSKTKNDNCNITKMLAMEQSSKVVLAGWQALKSFPSDLPDMLKRKPETDIGKLMSGNNIWTTIRSYVEQFGSGKLPPFIHRNILRGKQGDLSIANLPETLANCKVIIPMYLQKNSSNKTFLNNTLLLEVRRLHEGILKFNDADLLWALQAMVAYLILLAADDRRCNLLGILARIAMGEIASALKRNGYYSNNERNNNFPGWEEWVHGESKRRTFIMLHLTCRLLNMNIDPNRSCGVTEFPQIPLPSSSLLWEAETELKWSCEYGNYLSKRKSRRMIEVGDIQTVAKSGINSVVKDLVEDLSCWSKESDSFGSLLLVGGIYGWSC